jgi:hypothetical protein
MECESYENQRHTCMITYCRAMVDAHLHIDGSSMVTCSHYNSPLFIGCETRDSYKMVSKYIVRSHFLPAGAGS